MDYTMSLSLIVLPLLAADFDGDLFIWSLAILYCIIKWLDISLNCWDRLKLLCLYGGEIQKQVRRCYTVK